MAVSMMTPPAVSTRYLLSELRCSRSWQRAEIAEATETPVDQVARWDEHDLDALSPVERRQVEALLSVDSSQPWWSRSHDF